MNADKALPSMKLSFPKAHRDNGSDPAPAGCSGLPLNPIASSAFIRVNPRPMVLLLIALLALAPAAWAAEGIGGYHVDIQVLPDGGMEVAEHIRVRAEGSRIRRGIYRDFPTRYRDRYGNRVVVDFEVLGVERDGRPEPWFTEKLSNGVRVNTGNDDFLPVPREYTFRIRYRTTRQLGFFADHDELYWNVTGLGWEFAIDQASARVRLPAAVPAQDMVLEAYTGPQGAQGRDYLARVEEDGVAWFETTRPLSVNEGLTVVIGFPKGVIAEPTTAQRLGWLLYDNRGALVALAGLVLLLAWYLRSWHRVGRDPAAGPIFPRYEPPEGWSPAELRYLWKMGYSDRCFAADLVQLAVQGRVLIHQGGRSDWWLEWLPTPVDTVPVPPPQKALLDRLFSAGTLVELENSNAAVIGGARTAHHKLLDKRLHPSHFKRNTGPQALAWLFSIGYGLLALWLGDGDGLLLTIALLVLAVIVHAIFARLLKAPTTEGRRLLDAIEGLRLYLGVAERDELARLKAPGGGEAPVLDPERYQALLPYALALDVEEAWTRRFTAAVGAAQAEQTARSIGWYRGTGSIASLGAMSSSLGSALSSQISSSATPPGSSSGGGGGGSSGGGGGGGGGGGR